MSYHAVAEVMVDEAAGGAAVLETARRHAVERVAEDGADGEVGLGDLVR